MVISKESYPGLFSKLMENEQNLDVLVENNKSFNDMTMEKMGIRFGFCVLPDRIIVDDKCLDEFDEFLESHNIK